MGYETKHYCSLEMGQNFNLAKCILYLQAKINLFLCVPCPLTFFAMGTKMCVMKVMCLLTLEVSVFCVWKAVVQAEHNCGTVGVYFESEGGERTKQEPLQNHRSRLLT